MTSAQNACFRVVSTNASRREDILREGVARGISRLADLKQTAQMLANVLTATVYAYAMGMMRALLVYPEYPDTFWGFKHALKLISRKAMQPPLGLLTVAAMLPEHWEKKLVDMNVTKLRERDLAWADVVLVSAMSIQKTSVKQVIAKCKAAGVRTVAGGPLFMTDHEDFADVDHLLLNEAEITLPPFLEDLQRGCAKRMYTSGEFADMANTPVPAWNLIDVEAYASINMQYSRGCPYDCDFCEISVRFGRKIRTKSAEQVRAELESLYRLGRRGDVSFVDDNFIGDKRKLKEQILPAISGWNEARGHPFRFHGQASIDLSDDADLMRMMVGAGFDSVFIGIETTNDASLTECNKLQNRDRDLLSCVKRIQNAGLQVSAGFIVGFDSDPPSIFERLRAFIQESGIASAMVGLLDAQRHTKLYERLVKERRLLHDSDGNNMRFSMNFTPAMDLDVLIEGYKCVQRELYSPAMYYERVRRFLRDFRPPRNRGFRFSFRYVGAFMKSLVVLGIAGRERLHYWKLLLWTLFRRPRLFPLAVTCAIYGFHYRKFFDDYL